MNPDDLQVLGAMKEGTKLLDEICESAGAAKTMEFVDRLFILVRIGWIHEDNRTYSLTPEGAKQLAAQEPPIGDTPKPSTMELGRRPDEPSQTSSSAPVPMFHVRVDRFGNPRVIPFTPEERARETNRQQDPRTMEGGWKRRAKGISVLPPEWFTDGKSAY